MPSLILAFLISIPALARAADEPVPEDTCILELSLPPDAQLTVDGRDYGAKRTLTYSGIQPGKLRTTKLKVTFADRSVRDRVVYLESGRRVRLGMLSSAAKQPQLALQTGHASSALGAAFTADGRQLVTGDYSGVAAILWDVASGRQLRTYAGHTERIQGLAVSSRTDQIVTGSFDDTVIFWDRQSGRKLRTIATEFCFGLALSPDGAWLATLEHVHHNRIWDAFSGREVHRLSRHGDESGDGAAFRPDGKHCVVWYGNGLVMLWDVATGKALRILAQPAPGLQNVCYTADGRRVLMAWGESDNDLNLHRGELALCDALTGRRLAARTFKDKTVWGCATSADGRLAAANLTWGKGDDFHRVVQFLDPETLQPHPALGDKQDGGFLSVFAPDSRSLFDGVILWDCETGKAIQRFESRVQAISVAQFGSAAHTTLLDNSIIDLATEQELAHFTTGEPDERLQNQTLTADRRLLFATVSNPRTKANSLLVFDVGSAALLHRWTLPSHTDVGELSPSADGGSVAIKIGGHEISVLEAATGREVRRFSIAGGDCHVALSRDGRILASSPQSERSPSQAPLQIVNLGTVWDIETGRQIRTVKISWTAIDERLGGNRTRVTGMYYSDRYVFFTPDERRVVTATGENRSRMEFENDNGVSDSHQTLSSTGLWILWDISTGKSLKAFRGHKDEVYHVAFTPDSRYAVSASDDRTAIVWDVASGAPLRMFAGIRQNSAPSLSPDGRTLLAAAADGGAHVWDVMTGEELFAYFRLNKGEDWLAITPQGLFDGTEKGRQQVAFRVGDGLNLVPVDRFFQDFYRPGLLAELVAGGRPLPDVELGKSVPPKLRIVSPTNGGIVESADAVVEVEVIDEGGGVQGPWLRHNGARVKTLAEARREGKTLRQTFTVPLVEGDNRLRVEAASADGSWESEPAELLLAYLKDLPKPDLYVVAVGVDQYAESSLGLSFAAEDAQAVAALFRERGGKLYHKIQVQELINEQATRPAIIAALGEVAANSRPQDVLLMHLSGHGCTLGQRYYFIPHEFAKQSQRFEEDVRRDGLPIDHLEDALAKVPALKRMLVLDTCNSGAAAELGSGRRRNPFAFAGAVERLSRATGTFTLAAAAATADAIEPTELKHGVLTYALLAGLHGVDHGPLADSWVHTDSPEQVVDVLEWFNYASGQVPRLTRQYSGEAQDVKLCGEGNSFPVLPLGE